MWIRYLVNMKSNKAGDVVFVDDKTAKKILKKDKVVECIDSTGLPLVDATPEDQQAYLKAKKISEKKYIKAKKG